ncbi:hypothetical protein YASMINEVIRUS_175 [Yasminevirus sp. GU-2018]|uniref:Uncharacterized protein n=1 Tax=Yasminevirus sp. GU-2018 TaxID=2420051 RepID=A0A5K0U8I1_9VIRU|nr:hypothetical protein YASMINEVIRUS_175 [Yasminevirus sp. GU-2018]
MIRKSCNCSGSYDDSNYLSTNKKQMLRPIRSSRRDVVEGLCVLGMGDCGSENKLTIDSLTSVVNENIINVMMKTTNKIVTSCSADNTIRLNFDGADLDDCPIDVSQKASASCTLNANFFTKDNTDLINVINTAIDKSTDTDQSAVGSFLATTKNVNNTNIDMKTYINNIVNKNLTNEKLNECFAKVSASNLAELSFKGTKLKCHGKPLDFSQNAQAYLAATCIASNIGNIVSNDDILNKEIEKFNSSQSAKSKGLGELISDLLAPLLELFNCTTTVGMIIFAVIVVLLIASSAGSVFLMMGSGKSKSDK